MYITGLWKTEKERQLAKIQDEDYEVFMAIAEKLGKDRRGNPIYLRDDDGAEIFFEEEKKYLIIESNGGRKLKSRKVKIRKIDDELPKVVEAYCKFYKE